MRHRFALAAAATALLVAVAGCGSSKSNTSSTTGATTTAAAAHSTPAATSAASTASGTIAGSVVTISTKHSKAGTILAAGPKRLTVYLFEADKGSASSCSGACAKVWPPVTTKSAAIVAGGAKASSVGVITREGAVKQVTYGGHPLYFFARDGDSGDAYGQGLKSFGAGWYVVAPSGSKVDTS